MIALSVALLSFTSPYEITYSYDADAGSGDQSSGAFEAKDCILSRAYVSNNTRDLVGITILGNRVFALRDTTSLFSHTKSLNSGRWTAAFGIVKPGGMIMHEGFVANGTTVVNDEYPRFCNIIWPLFKDTWLPYHFEQTHYFPNQDTFSKLGVSNYQDALFESNLVSRDGTVSLYTSYNENARKEDAQEEIWSLFQQQSKQIRRKKKKYWMLRMGIL